jgi:hypothetical protein
MAGDPLPPRDPWQRSIDADLFWLGCLIVGVVMAGCALLFLSVLP